MTAIGFCCQTHAVRAQAALGLSLIETNATKAKVYANECLAEVELMLSAEDDLFVGTSAGFATSSQSSSNEVRVLELVPVLH